MNEFVLLSGNPFVYLTMLNFLMHHPDSDATSAERPFMVSPVVSPHPQSVFSPQCVSEQLRSGRTFAGK